MSYKRSFFIQNFIITKAPNWLSLINTNQLQFIYINKWLLAKKEPKLIYFKRPIEKKWETESNSELKPKLMFNKNNWLEMTKDQEVKRKALTNITIDLTKSEEKEEKKIEKIYQKIAQLDNKQLHDFFLNLF